MNFGLIVFHELSTISCSKTRTFLATGTKHSPLDPDRRTQTSISWCSLGWATIVPIRHKRLYSARWYRRAAPAVQDYQRVRRIITHGNLYQDSSSAREHRVSKCEAPFHPWVPALSIIEALEVGSSNKNRLRLSLAFSSIKPCPPYTKQAHSSQIAGRQLL